MYGGETARKNLDVARQEIITRLQLRDQALLGYLATVGVFFTLALGTSVSPTILFVVPFLALGVTLLLSQHSSAIGALALYCVKELLPFMQKLDPSETAPMWDSSETLQEYSSTLRRLQTGGQACILIVPCLFALILTSKYALGSQQSEWKMAWWVGAICTLAVVCIIVGTYLLRSKMQKQLFGKTILGE